MYKNSTPRVKNVNLEDIHYKNAKLLRQFLTPAGSILPREKTGLTAKMQRKISREIKRARHMALLPYATQMM